MHFSDRDIAKFHVPLRTLYKEVAVFNNFFYERIYMRFSVKCFSAFSSRNHPSSTSYWLIVDNMWKLVGNGTVGNGMVRFLFLLYLQLRMTVEFCPEDIV